MLVGNDIFVCFIQCFFHCSRAIHPQFASAYPVVNSKTWNATDCTDILVWWVCKIWLYLKQIKLLAAIVVAVAVFVVAVAAVADVAIAVAAAIDVVAAAYVLLILI